jgi:hypothetical protein
MSIAIDEHQYRAVVLLFDSCAAVIEVDEAKHESHGYFRVQFLASMPRAIPRDPSYGITPGLCTSRRDLYDSGLTLLQHFIKHRYSRTCSRCFCYIPLSCMQHVLLSIHPMMKRVIAKARVAGSRIP